MKFEVNDLFNSIRKDKDPEFLNNHICAETQHYLNAFQRGQLANWNWAAFLFLPIWMLYRCLYAPYCVFIVVSILLSYIPGTFLLVGLLANIAMGVYADSIYIYFVKQEFQRGRTLNPGNIPLGVLVCFHLIVVLLISKIQMYLDS